MKRAKIRIDSNHMVIMGFNLSSHTHVIQSPNTDESTDLTDNGLTSQIYSELENFKQLFKRPKFYRKDCDIALSNLHKFALGLQAREDDLPSEFINNDVETVWQFISYRGKQIIKDFRKNSVLLEVDVKLRDEEKSGSEECSDEDSGSDAYSNEFCGAEHDEMNMIHEKDRGLKELEHEQEYMDQEDQEDKFSDRPEIHPKSAVDDKFFSLAEMNAFLDEQDRVDWLKESVLETVDVGYLDIIHLLFTNLTNHDSLTNETNYCYEDFFGQRDEASKSERVKNKTEIDKKEKKKKSKTVRFAVDSDDTENGTSVYKVITHEENVVDNASVLLGEEKRPEEQESNLNKSLKRVLSPRNRFLVEKDYCQVRRREFGSTILGAERRAPDVTEVFTEKLEDLIRQRIKDKAFDDVIRKKRIEERADVYRSKPIEEQEMVKVSLAQVYEKEYQKAVGQLKSSESVNEKHQVIEKEMRELFRLIDALSNFDYTPPEVQHEVRVVSNMPALTVEEVGMSASTDAQLLAPEEIKKHQKGDLKSVEERTSTDKLRQRRKKKNRQRALVEVLGEKALDDRRKIKKRKLVNDQDENSVKKN
ncbi:Mpp10 protein [Dictyocaulus viviparus]|uniref:U3 small nucleolar ribonucleoprotein protein MPP10 n=1 Tax=Dictyocaulus viviparus TaxID=29172 RepID=A0A0D8XIH9_DICVI|nr:Mpp10 protein [Dictyocaulus viviparus]